MELEQINQMVKQRRRNKRVLISVVVLIVIIEVCKFFFDKG